MRFTNPSIAAFAVVPSSVRAWNMGPSFFTASRPLVLFSPASRMIDEQRMLARRMFDLQSVAEGSSLSRPNRSYQLVDNKEKFQISVDVPGFKTEDIDVRVQDGYVTISGQRVVTTETSRSSSKFSQSFSLDPTVDVEHFAATLDNGVLTVSAPKDMTKLEDNVRRIPITATTPAVAGDVDQAPPASSDAPETKTTSSDTTLKITNKMEAEPSTGVPEVETIDLDEK